MRVTPTVHAAAGHKEQRVERQATGLGGNTRGSEGYGEITEGSLRVRQSDELWLQMSLSSA